MPTSTDFDVRAARLEALRRKAEKINLDLIALAGPFESDPDNPNRLAFMEPGGEGRAVKVYEEGRRAYVRDRRREWLPIVSLLVAILALLLAALGYLRLK